MPDLSFQVESVAAVPFAAAPLLALKLAIADSVKEEVIHSVALRCQIQIEVTRRRYSAEDQERLIDLFGEPSRWGQTLRSMLWTHVSAVVPQFTGSTTIELKIPCTFDFNVAATKYFYGLEDGEIPLNLMFSGTVFYQRTGLPLQVSPISWEKETRFRLPLDVWRGMMDIYYPNAAWLCLRRDVFDRLNDYKTRNGFPTWEQALESVLDAAKETVSK